MRLAVSVKLHAIGLARAGIGRRNVVPAPLNQNLLFGLDGSCVTGTRVRDCKCQLALVDAELPSSRILFCIGTCQHYAVRQLGVFRFERSQIGTQPESDSKWLIPFNV